MTLVEAADGSGVVGGVISSGVALGASLGVSPTKKDFTWLSSVCFSLFEFSPAAALANFLANKKELVWEKHA